MKKALICPNESVTNGYRIAQVEPAENIFDVAEPMYWIDCDNAVVADLWYYDTKDRTIKENPQYSITRSQPTTSGAQTL